jgi:uncharacterized membrane protein YoaT (DUF817 family)
MTDGLLVALFIVLAVIVYVVAKVWAYSRKSDAQWRAVDKSKLKEWDDDD